MTNLYLFNEDSRASAYGIGTYIKQLLSCVEMEDYNVSVIHFRSDRKEFEIEVRNAVTYYYIPNSYGYDSYTKKDISKYYRNALYILSSYIKKADRLIFHVNYNQSEPLLDLLKSEWPEAKTVFTLHYQNWCFALKGNTSYFKQIIHKPKDELTDDIEKSIYNSFEEECSLFSKVDCVVCLSTYTYNLLLSEYGVPKDKLKLIHNGLMDDVSMLCKEEKVSLKKKLYIDSDEKILLFVGRLDETKGVYHLIKAFKQLLETESNCRLFIVGDGMFSSFLRASTGCWSKITFTGRIEKEELYQLYQIADLGILPSLNEQCSYVAIEMMMFGLPIISTTSTGLDEMIDAGYNGYKIAIKEEDNKISLSSEELLNLMQESLHFQSLSVLSDNARKRYSEKYCLTIMQYKVLDVYNNL